MTGTSVAESGWVVATEMMPAIVKHAHDVRKSFMNAMSVSLYDVHAIGDREIAAARTLLVGEAILP